MNKVINETALLIFEDGGCVLLPEEAAELIDNVRRLKEALSVTIGHVPIGDEDWPHIRELAGE